MFQEYYFYKSTLIKKKNQTSALSFSFTNFQSYWELIDKSNGFGAFSTDHS